MIRSLPIPHLRWVWTSAFALTLLAAPSVVAAQDTDEEVERALDEARELQRDFERLRERRTPVSPARSDAVCDERIGRICIWFGGEGEADFPSELREVQQGRVELLRGLFDLFERVPDKWILGQIVHYLVENRDMREASRVATECGIPEAWWCSALQGYVLHVWTRYVDAEVAFREALETMPAAQRREWMLPRYVVTRDGAERFASLSDLELDLEFDLFWQLSDPLFLFEGNDRLTDHFARWVVALNRREAADPMGMEWREDVEEALIRYGRNIGYSRTHDPSRMFGGGSMRDTRRMVGHHHPQSRGYLFPEQYIEAPADIPPESWITAPRVARTWYAPPYAPEVRTLETQVGRFRRDDQMLVVGAYRPTIPDEDGGVLSAWDAEGETISDPVAALFLVPEEGGEPLLVRGDDAEGVFTVESWPGRYVASLEVVDLEGRQAWRARQGIVQNELIYGLVGVSDLMILKDGAPIPNSLEEALPHIRPGIRLRPGERFPVLWEVYGLAVQESVGVTIGFSRGRPGFLERVGEFLGVIEPERTVEITFDETNTDVVQEAFRAIQIELPDLDAGEYTLHLRLDPRRPGAGDHQSADHR